MNVLNDVLTYIRRIVKSASDQVISDALLIDYVNRFYTSDVAARLQLFELKTKYSFVTQPLVDQYNIPYYNQVISAGSAQIAPYPIYQMLQGPVLCDGVEIPLYTDRSSFVKVYPNFYTNEDNDVVGDGSSTYSFSTVNNPVLRGNIDVIGTNAVANGQAVPYPSINSAVFITAINANNNLVTLQDVGPSYPTTSPTNDGNVGNLMLQSNLQSGSSVVSGQINYQTGAVTSANFGVSIPSGNFIQMKYVTFSAGFVRMAIFYNNTVLLRPVPDTVYLLEFDAYLTPAAFLTSSQALPFGYMTEYLARGAARKLLSDTGDWEQFDRYEPLFKEQEMLLIRRTDRQRSVNRTPTIFTDRTIQGGYGNQPGQGS